MKIVNIIDDSHNGGVGERVIYVVELEPSIFVDVMVINDGLHSKNFPYIMEFDGGEVYTNTSDGVVGIRYDFNQEDVIGFVVKYVEVMRGCEENFE